METLTCTLPPSLRLAHGGRPAVFTPSGTKTSYNASRLGLVVPEQAAPPTSTLKGPFTRKTFKLPSPLHDRFRRHANAMGQFQYVLLCEAIRQYLQPHDETAGVDHPAAPSLLSPAAEEPVTEASEPRTNARLRCVCRRFAQLVVRMARGARAICANLWPNRDRDD